MTIADLLDLLFVAFVFGLLPRAARRSSRMISGDPGASRPRPTRRQILGSTAFSLAILGVFSWVVARVHDWNPLWSAPIGTREIAAGVVALAFHFVLRSVVRSWRSPEEQAKAVARSIAPRQPNEWPLYALVCVLAGVAEEITYRGVAVWVLAPWIGTVPAMLASAIAFALSHAAQRWKAMVVVFGMAMTMHGLVAFTEALPIAMVVHAVYDLCAGWLFARERAREGRAAAASSA